MLSGMLAGAVTLSCQALVVAPQSAGLGVPRTVIHFGAVKLDADADMAIVLNRQDCAERDYSLKQVPGPDPRVERIVVEITGTGLVEPLLRTIMRSQFTGCDATLNLTGLAPGDYNVRFTSYNLAGDPVAYANGSATVALGTTPQLNLVCDFNMGSLDVNIHCCDDAAPTPAPSATPSPSPTPTSSADPCSTIESFWNGGYGVSDIGVGTDGTIYGAGQWITRNTPDGVFVDIFKNESTNSIAVDASGDIWYTARDGAGSQVRKVNSAGGEFFSVNIGPSTSSISKLTIDQNGYVWAYYATSLYDYRLVKISSAGAVLSSTPIGAGRPLPYAIEVDPSGNAWVSFQDGWIEKYDLSGNLFNSFDSGGNWPRDLTFDALGNAWVLNSQDNTVSKFAPDNSLLGTFPVGENPESVIIDRNGNIWVSNAATGGTIEMKKLAPDGTELESLPCLGGYDMSLDNDGNILIPNGSKFIRFTP